MHNDPYQMISEKIKKHNISTYEHQADQELQKFANIESWEQVQEDLISSKMC